MTMYTTSGARYNRFQMIRSIIAAGLVILYCVQPLITFPHTVSASDTPSDPPAARALARLLVAQPGNQCIDGAAFQAAGVDLSTTPRALLRIVRHNQSMAIRINEQSDGYLGAADRICFTAPQPGDRWNTADTYWLMVESEPDAGLQTTADTPETGILPQTLRHTPVDLTMPSDLTALYIAPREFHAALAPLLAHRQAQGYRVAVADLQAIYDWWSGGQVDPLAIRSFLRDLRDRRQIALQGVTLVGDGTSEPFDAAGRNTINIIPPFMAPVDLWLGEAACELCFAQLDGDDPLSDTMPDVALGRFPVKNVAELEALVAKILAYETGPVEPDWQGRAIYLSDNGYNADGAADPAGDFPAYAERLAARAPQGMMVQRVYYDPSPGRPNTPWYEPDAQQAHTRALGLIAAGAALLTYMGHGTPWQLAQTDVNQAQGYLLGMDDIEQLGNVGRPAVMLLPACTTAAFALPSFSGETLGERLLLAPGGAVAVLGATGKNLPANNLLLAQGFEERLYTSAERRIGRLMLAGYETLQHGMICCENTVRTYTLLGDPLTEIRMVQTYRVALPGIVK